MWNYELWLAECISSSSTKSVFSSTALSFPSACLGLLCSISDKLSWPLCYYSIKITIWVYLVSCHTWEFVFHHIKWHLLANFLTMVWWLSRIMQNLYQYIKCERTLECRHDDLSLAFLQLQVDRKLFIFKHFSTFRKSFIRFKNTGIWHSVITEHIYFATFRWRSFKFHKEFEVDMILYF